ncbi:YbaB/EbfC family nucleoid-associated protein [Paremcibacter congregatus]|uniref:Nucleoid-associated protein CRD36_01860 n=1 Tax=Paremcibacter congregatus TaxID=2043170 RepID=A0A2G4YWE1_9PROT|nr:YbaB/EbfC family nucleoid-associated protein [Paremcibacter congregatus]PHZ86645.1 YbaB/EbfC family nucleoid-associated protein [Paremcibacter congregatus]QDE26446.1 YbaB/EbfC family nucleoid-associated protein [Paremcibacter congregatus]|tara:strand:+ start:1519 stop:1842 length:324 start_codon:yes stop_codon:yes gene_type:complete
MKNLGKMMKQAQEMQGKMTEMQEALEKAECTGQSGGGLVTVTLNGKGNMRSLKIDPSIFNGDDAEMVEDLIVAAFNDAKRKVEEHSQAEMQKVTGGLQLPEGFNLPF